MVFQHHAFSVSFHPPLTDPDQTLGGHQGQPKESYKPSPLPPKIKQVKKIIIINNNHYFALRNGRSMLFATISHFI